MPNCAEGTKCNDRRSLLCTAGGLGGAVSTLASPGQSAGGGEALVWCGGVETLVVHFLVS